MYQLSLIANEQCHFRRFLKRMGCDGRVYEREIHLTNVNAILTQSMAGATPLLTDTSVVANEV